MRDCENCKNHTDKGCTKWKCEFEPTTKNDLGVASELEKNSKKLEKDFGELDCISRQAVLDIAKTSKSNWIDNSILFKRVNALPSVTPQEPFINKPCVSSEVCEHDKQKVLDKIRAEIIELRSRQNVGVLECLDIIEKYKAESEG